MVEGKPGIVVVGGVNADFFFGMQRLPLVGETMQSNWMEVHSGGKVTTPRSPRPPTKQPSALCLESRLPSSPNLGVTLMST